MKKLSEIYKDLGIAFKFPIDIKNKNGNVTYYENSDGFWYRKEYDESGYGTYFENSDGFWTRREYDKNGNKTYYENSEGLKRGTKKGSCADKIVEVDGKKYKLTEL